MRSEQLWAAATGAAVLMLATQASAQENCEPTPYTVRISNLGGEIQARITADATAKLLKKTKPLAAPGAATTGAEYVAAAISGASEGAFNRVFQSYICKARKAVEADIAKNKLPPSELTEFDRRVGVLTGYLGDAQIAVASGTLSDVRGKLADLRNNAAARIETPLGSGPSEALRTTVTKAIDIKATDFTLLKRVSGWATLKSKGLNVGACGGVIFNVLEAAHGDLQVALSTTPNLFLTYFSTPAAAKNATQALMVNYITLLKDKPEYSGLPAMTPAFQNCTSGMLATLDPVAASATAQAASMPDSASPKPAGGPVSPVPTSGAAPTTGSGATAPTPSAQPTGPAPAPAAPNSAATPASSVTPK